MYTCQDQCIHCHHHKVISLLYVRVKDRTPAHHRKLENNFSNFKFRAHFLKNTFVKIITSIFFATAFATSATQTASWQRRTKLATLERRVARRWREASWQCLWLVHRRRAACWGRRRRGWHCHCHWTASQWNVWSARAYANKSTFVLKIVAFFKNKQVHLR